MPNDKNHTDLKLQRKNKPQIEDFIIKYLDNDEMKQNALDFNTYMQNNKMPLRYNGTLNTWRANYKGNPLCFIGISSPGIPRGSWRIRLRFNNMETHEETIIKEGLHNNILDKLRFCTHGQPSNTCSTTKGCAGGMNITLFGKDYKKVCCAIEFMSFLNPNEVTINSIKKLLELEKDKNRE